MAVHTYFWNVEKVCSLIFGTSQDIREIICNHVNGEETLREMDKNRAVSKENRKVVVHSLVSHLMKEYGS